MFTPEETIAFLKREADVIDENAPKPYAQIDRVVGQIEGLYYVTAQTEKEPRTGAGRHFLAFMVSEKAQPIFNNIYIELSNIVEGPDKLIQLIQRRPVTLRRGDEVVYSRPTNLFFIMHYLSGSEFDMMMQANIFACNLRDAIKLVCGELSNFKHLDSVIEKMKGN